jgi:hypothetical protein
MRIQDAWRFHEDVRALAANTRILVAQCDLRPKSVAVPDAEFPGWHTTAIPLRQHSFFINSRTLYVGVWVAPEDISPDAGPLEYYPGSHTWPIIYNDKIGVFGATGLAKGARSQELYHDVWQALVAKHGIKPQYFSPKKGEAVIWAANLLHGGSRQHDPNLTRWSQVTHYFFENCCYITPVQSDIFIGKLALRSLTNIATGEAVPNIYIDTPLFKIGHGSALLRAWRRKRLPSLGKMVSNVAKLPELLKR